MPGQSIFEFTEKSRHEYFKTVIAAVLQGQTIQYDRSYTETEGRIAWITFTFTPVKHKKIIVGVCITANDITDKKIADQQKEFDHNNLHALINNTTDLMWSVDRNYKLITFNKAAENFALLLTGQIIAPGLDLFTSGFGNEVQKRYKLYYDRALNGEMFTEQSYSPAPTEYWSENSFYPIYEGEKVVGTACFSHNITARKKAEERLQKSYDENKAISIRIAAILNTLPANIALLDEKGLLSILMMHGAVLLMTIIFLETITELAVIM